MTSETSVTLIQDGSVDEYSEVSGELFLAPDNGGRQLAQALTRVPDVGIKDTWISDSIKCLPDEASDNRRSAEFAHCKQHLAAEIDSVAPTVIVALGAQPVSRVLDVLGPDEGRISVASPKTDCGKILDTDPPVIVAPHWSYEHLRSRPGDDWGEGWADDAEYLSRDRYGSHLQIVQEALQHAYAE